MRARPRRAFVAAAVRKCSGVEGVDGRAVLDDEGQMVSIARRGRSFIEWRPDEKLGPGHRAIGDGIAADAEEFGLAEERHHRAIKAFGTLGIIGADSDVAEHGEAS